MSCNTSLTSIIKSCDYNSGGVTEVILAPMEFILSTTDSGGTVSNIGLTAGTFVEYEFNKNSASYLEEAQINLDNGSTFYKVTLSLSIPRREVAKRQSLSLIAAGQRDLAIIIKDGNGLYWYMGYEEGANLTELGEGSGATKGDGSKYSLTFVADSNEMMLEVDPLIIPTLL